MPETYHNEVPFLKLRYGEPDIGHAHIASYHKSSDKEHIDKLKNCIVFFKAYAENKHADPQLRAAARFAINKDKEFLAQCSSCNIL